MYTRKTLAIFAFAAVVSLAIPRLGLAGDVQFPPIVQADGRGQWSVQISVSGTDNPQFRTAGLPVNTSLYSTQTQLPDGTFEITLGGQLIDKAKDGSVRFFVDPNGAGYPQAITILHGNPTAFLDLTRAGT